MRMACRSMGIDFPSMGIHENHFQIVADFRDINTFKCEFIALRNIHFLQSSAISGTVRPNLSRLTFWGSLKPSRKPKYRRPISMKLTSAGLLGVRVDLSMIQSV